MTMPRYEAIADTVLPVDGPHTPERMRQAAYLVEELVRRLIYATQPHRAATTLPFPADVAVVIGSAETVLTRLPQLARQLAGRLHTFGTDPRTGVDDLGQPMDPQVLVSIAAADLGAAASTIAAAADLFRAAHRPADRLTFTDPKEAR